MKLRVADKEGRGIWIVDQDDYELLRIDDNGQGVYSTEQIERIARDMVDCFNAYVAMRRKFLVDWSVSQSIQPRTGEVRAFYAEATEWQQEKLYPRAPFRIEYADDGPYIFLVDADGDLTARGKLPV